MENLIPILLILAFFVLSFFSKWYAKKWIIVPLSLGLLIYFLVMFFIDETHGIYFLLCAILSVIFIRKNRNINGFFGKTH